MRYRRPLRACLYGQRGAGATEYLILFVLVALAVIALYGKFGRTVGGNVHVSGKRVETLGEDQDGHIVEGQPSSTRAGADGSGSSAVSGSRGEVLPEPVAARDGEGKTVDTRSVILLGIVGLAIGMLMILSVFQRVRKAQKRAKLQR